ncbi:MAG TPA: penicillin-binding protein 1C, partial [Treponemataceae bacterium]|nr:penicillin-binding protein 1C [Treponemataceae bacterium]
KLLAASVADDGQWRLPESSVPDRVGKAMIAFEDRRFRAHPGVDPLALARAVAVNALRGRVVSGGSTITMQTARLLGNNPPRTIAQKAREAVIAILLEARYSKKEILSLYAANAPFGGNVVGIEAASWRYFNRPPDALSWAEAATLAVLPNQPSLVRPGAKGDVMKAKRDRLLKVLYRRGCFDRGILGLSLDEPLPDEPYPLPSLAPHYLNRYRGEGRVVTDIDRDLQQNLVRILERWSSRFALRGIDNAATIVLDTKTGAILAYVGNTGVTRDGGRNGDVDVAISRRSSGSVLKPFLFAGMLDSGLLLPDQLVTDIPTRIGSYKPENNLPEYSGAVRAGEALSRSLNVPAIRELRDYGIAHFLDLLRRSGFTTLTRTADEYGLPLVLGGGEVTLEETTRAYAALMNRAAGADKPSRASHTPHTQHNSRAFPESPVSRGAAWLTLEALLYGNRPEDEALWQSYASARKIAWKTGTSYGNRDAWAIGTTPTYTVGIWIGNATGEGRPELKSISTAAPVLFDIFSILPATDWPAFPEKDLEPVRVCARSGYLAGPECSETTTSLKPRAAASGAPCPYCKRVSLTPDGKWQAVAGDLTGEFEGSFPRTESRFVLPPQIEYWYRKHDSGYRPLPPWIPGHVGDSSKPDLVIVFPEPLSRVFIPKNIEGKKESIVLEARHRNHSEILYWDIDGEFIGETQYVHELTASPRPGKHRLTVTDTRGNRDSRSFEVLDENQ